MNTDIKNAAIVANLRVLEQQTSLLAQMVAAIASTAEVGDYTSASNTILGIEKDIEKIGEMYGAICTTCKLTTYR